MPGRISSTLPRGFYRRDTVLVARELLGKRLVRRIGGCKVSGIIIETEAYGHQDDPASHASKRMTERNKVMFGEVGMAYVYFTYGMHFCFNVVARDDKAAAAAAAGAVLIRAVRPDTGIDIMIQNRGVKDVKRLTDGPAKLAQAMGITKEEHNGVDLTMDRHLFVTEGIRAGRIFASPRVGIKKATDLMWNFKMCL